MKSFEYVWCETLRNNNDSKCLYNSLNRTVNEFMCNLDNSVNVNNAINRLELNDKYNETSIFFRLLEDLSSL